MPLYGAYIWSLTWAPQLSQNVVVNAGFLYDTPLMLWWAIKVTLCIIIPETSWFCSLPYNHRIFSLSTHTMTDKNLWLLMWVFLCLQLPCFNEEFYLAAHKNNSSHVVNISITVWVISFVYSLLACPACYSLFTCNSIFTADFSTRIHFPLPKFSDSPLYL